MSNNRVIYFTSLLVALILLVTLNDKPAITGYATFAAREEARSVIDTFSKDNSFQFLGQGAQLCVVVEINNQTTYYYKITKFGDSADVEESYCADPGQDNVIVKFNSYDDLLAFNAGPAKFVTTRKNTGYYIFPSNNVQSGGDVSCSETFQKDYCVPLYYYLSKSDISKTGLVCCANYELTADEKAKMAELKKGTTESPLAFLSALGIGFNTTTIIIIIGIVLFVVIISALILVKPKNPLSDYVNSARIQGFADDDIRQALTDGGWDAKTVEDALKTKK